MFGGESVSEYLMLVIKQRITIYAHIMRDISSLAILFMYSHASNLLYYYYLSCETFCYCESVTL